MPRRRDALTALPPEARAVPDEPAVGALTTGPRNGAGRADATPSKLWTTGRGSAPPSRQVAPPAQGRRRSGRPRRQGRYTPAAAGLFAPVPRYAMLRPG